MKTKFYIDQQFAAPIWLEVENGKINQFLGTSTMVEALNERYCGTQISIFKEEFENMMKPAWYCVKSDSWANLRQVVQAINSRISFLKRELYDNKKLGSEKTEGFKNRIVEHGKELNEAKKNLDLEIETLSSVHGFLVPEKKLTV